MHARVYIYNPTIFRAFNHGESYKNMSDKVLKKKKEKKKRKRKSKKENIYFRFVA